MCIIWFVFECVLFLWFTLLVLRLFVSSLCFVVLFFVFSLCLFLFCVGGGVVGGVVGVGGGWVGDWSVWVICSVWVIAGWISS